MVTYNTVLILSAGYEIVNNQYMVYGGDNVFSPGIGAPMTEVAPGVAFLANFANVIAVDGGRSLYT